MTHRRRTNKRERLFPSVLHHLPRPPHRDDAFFLHIRQDFPLSIFAHRSDENLFQRTFPIETRWTNENARSSHSRPPLFLLLPLPLHDIRHLTTFDGGDGQTTSIFAQQNQTKDSVFIVHFERRKSSLNQCSSGATGERESERTLVSSILALCSLRPRRGEWRSSACSYNERTNGQREGDEE